MPQATAVVSILVLGCTATTLDSPTLKALRFFIGLVGIGIGGVMTPLGWTMYAQSFKRKPRDRESRAPTPVAAPELKLSFRF